MILIWQMQLTLTLLLYRSKRRFIYNISGHAAKKHYTQPGGGVDFQCLPIDPEFPQGATGGHTTHAYIYGVEYEHNSYFWGATLNADVPCAVCSVTGRARQLMIPAKLSCPQDWTYEYDGMLATDRAGHWGATYICVDKAAEPAA